MIEWSEQHLMVRDMVRGFIEKEIAPNIDELEHGDTPPYDVLRKLIKTFGMDTMAKSQFDAQIKKAKAIEAGEISEEEASKSSDQMGGGNQDMAAISFIPMIELCKYCPGMVTAMGVSMGLGGASLMSKGTIEQKERWALHVLTLKKVCPCAIT